MIGRKYYSILNFSLGKTPTYIRMDKLSHDALENQIDPNVTPENVFIINNTVEAKRALKYVQDSTWNYKSGQPTRNIVLFSLSYLIICFKFIFFCVLAYIWYLSRHIHYLYKGNLSVLITYSSTNL